MTDTKSNADQTFVPVRVECYSGYKADEHPIAFDFQGRGWEIAEIIDRWYEGGICAKTPIINYFKVRAACEDREKSFILRYSSDTDAWAVLIPDLA